MIHIGNNIDVLRQYPDNYFDSVVTDPPYGLGKEPEASEVMKSWLSCGYHEIKGSGFMGKEWDVFVPQPLFWKEVYRVVKPGAHVLSFFGTRTYDWGVMAMRFAGFEVRDCIQWLYGSGFPKSHNISKAIDKLNGTYIEGEISPNSRQGKYDDVVGFTNFTKKRLFDAQSENARQWDGWGSALKPANEPIVLARKPLEKGLSIAENVLKWGTGGINIDGCRVSFKDDADFKESTTKNQHADFGTAPMTNNQVYGDWSMIQPQNYQPTGRFPANIILTHHLECECKGLKKVKGTRCESPSDCKTGSGATGDTYKNIQGNRPPRGIGDENNEETVEDWNCHPDCPIKILDEQSGVSKSPSKVKSGGKTFHGQNYDERGENKECYNDTGGASRFFYCAKASKSERNKGLEGFERKRVQRDNGRDKGMNTSKIRPDGSERKQTEPKTNFHPTVKPIKLMQYLVRLITPPNGLVLDPFVGSGTTGIAAKLEGLQFVGIEQNQEYARICISRINAVLSKCHPKYEQPKLF